MTDIEELMTEAQKVGQAMEIYGGSFVEHLGAARLGYSAAIYQLEKFMAEITDEIEIEVDGMEVNNE